MAPGISEAVDVLQDAKEKGGLEVPKLSRPTMERRTSAFVELLDEETNLQVLLSHGLFELTPKQSNSKPGLAPLILPEASDSTSDSSVSRSYGNSPSSPASSLQQSSSSMHHPYSSRQSAYPAPSTSKSQSPVSISQDSSPTTTSSPALCPRASLARRQSEKLSNFSRAVGESIQVVVKDLRSNRRPTSMVQPPPSPEITETSSFVHARAAEHKLLHFPSSTSLSRLAQQDTFRTPFPSYLPSTSATEISVSPPSTAGFPLSQSSKDNYYQSSERSFEFHKADEQKVKHAGEEKRARRSLSMRPAAGWVRAIKSSFSRKGDSGKNNPNIQRTNAKDISARQSFDVRRHSPTERIALASPSRGRPIAASNSVSPPNLLKITEQVEPASMGRSLPLSFSTPANLASYTTSGIDFGKIATSRTRAASSTSLLSASRPDTPPATSSSISTSFTRLRMASAPNPAPLLPLRARALYLANNPLALAPSISRSSTLTPEQLSAYIADGPRPQSYHQAIHRDAFSDSDLSSYASEGAYHSEDEVDTTSSSFEVETDDEVGHQVGSGKHMMSKLAWDAGLEVEKGMVGVLDRDVKVW